MMNTRFGKSDYPQFPFWVFTISVFIIAILPSLVQDGMFIDGLQYAVVSKNLADGLGSFWTPYICQNWYFDNSEIFLEHPPLVYAIQGFFFKIFGDGMYTERIYCLFTALISALFIVRIWKLINRSDEKMRKLSWLPVLLWVSMPVVFRQYQMNVHENTVGIFILASVYFIFKGLERNTRSYLYIILGGVFIFLATLSKGVTALFPLVAVVVYWLSGAKIKFSKVLVLSFILVIVPILLYGLVLLNDNANESLSFYFYSRFLDKVNNLPVVDSHFHIIFRLFLDLLPIMIVTTIIVITHRKKVKFEKLERKRHVFFFLLMGLAGSLPLSLTLVQREFYLGPSLPFFALAFALFVSLYVVDDLERFSRKVHIFNSFRVLGVLLLVGGLLYTGFQIGKAERDQDILHDTYLLGEIIEEGTRVHLLEDHEDHWRLELYLGRYCEVCLGASIEESKYVIRSLKDSAPDSELFKLVPLNTRTYQLYEQKN